MRCRLLFYLLPGMSAAGWEGGQRSGKGTPEVGNYSSPSEPIIPLHPRFARDRRPAGRLVCKPHGNNSHTPSLGKDTTQVKPVKTRPVPG